MRSLVEIKTLRPRFNALLLNQIKNALPKLISDIESAIETCQQQLDKLGGSRITLDEQRSYLIKIGQSFQSIVDAAVDGSYSNAFFTDPSRTEGYTRRLRAVVQNLNNDFTENMQLRGKQFNISDNSVQETKIRGQSLESSFLQAS